METKITAKNLTWGFFGTLTSAGVANADELFDATARELTAQLKLTADEARLVLDATIGRHMADQYQNGESATTLVARLIGKGWSRDLRRAAGHRADPQRRTEEILLRVQPDEVAVLRFALDHALSSISEAHPKDRAQLQALIERLTAATQPTKRRS